MRDILLHSPSTYLYLLYAAALVAINVIDAVIRQPEPAGKTDSVGGEPKTADISRSEAA